MRVAFAIIALLFAACNRTIPTKSYLVQQVTPTEIADFIDTTNVRHIELESCDEALMGNLILKLKMEDNDIYFLDSGNATIFRFDANTGKFKNCICHKGRGPQEVILIEDFDVRDGRVYILSMGDNRVLTFDIDGKFITSIKTKYPFYSIQADKDYKVWLSSKKCNKSGYELHLIDATTAQTIMQIGEFDPNMQMSLIDGFCTFKSSSSNNIIVTEPYDNTLYRIENDTITPYITLKFEDFSTELTAKQKKDLTYSEKSELYSNADQLKHYVDVVENNNTIFVTANCTFNKLGGRNCLIKINKHSAEAKLISLENYHPNKYQPHYNRIFPYSGGIGSAGLVALRYPNELRRNPKFANLDQYANPIVFFYPLKL